MYYQINGKKLIIHENFVFFSNSMYFCVVAICYSKV